jgi:hypothetical protein
MAKIKQETNRKRLSAVIKHMQLDEDVLLIKDKSNKNGTLKPNVHPYVRELLSSR